MAVSKIEKRNKEIVDFNSDKIFRAISRAFQDVQGGFDTQQVEAVAKSVVNRINEIYSDTKLATVENVQDIVEHTLMEWGFFDIAKSYIIYRREHEKQRIEEKQDTLNKIGKKKLIITKSSGKTEHFDERKLRQTLSYVAKGFEDVVNIDTIIQQVEADLYDGISTKEISRTLTMTVRSFIEQDPAYSTVASRLLIKSLYKDVIGQNINFQDLDKEIKNIFVINTKKAVQKSFLTQDMLSFDLEMLSQALKPERDDLFTYLGAQTLYDRFFVEDPTTKQIYETPQAFWMRVAMGLALPEKLVDRNKWALKFYEVMSTMRYVPATPTLFHAGTNHPQLSACYLNTIEDDLHHIFKVIGDNAQLSKWSGGIGTDWTNLRGTGAIIKKIGVESQGIVPFLKVANDTTSAINRSGKRRGAAAVYLETWHYDIEDYLELRKNTGDERRRTHDIDTVNWIPDLFMKRVRQDADWTLFSPDETPDLHHIYGKEFEQRYAQYEQMAQEGSIRLHKTIKAKDLWKRMVTMLFETGHPWMTWKDPSNVRSPQDHVGVIHCSNLCTEITLNTSETETAVCNLGSVNLGKFVKDKKFDVHGIKEVVTVAMRMLDNVVDINFYPTDEGKHSNMQHRPVGLGLMGFQDALYQLDIDFASEECVKFADKSMEVISYYAILGSSQIAEEKGPYPSYKGSKWDRGLFPIDTIALLEQERGMKIDVDRFETLDWSLVRDSVKQYGMRNSNTMAIAPTATNANRVGATPAIEPIYKNIYVKSNQSGDFTVVNNYLIEDLKKLNLWDEEMLGKLKYHDGDISNIVEIPQHIRAKYKEVFDIDPKWLIKAAAYRAKWIDQSQSLNIFYKGTSGKEISDIYMYAWELGLKTTYYLRTLAISQVEKSTVNTSEFGVTHKRQAGVISENQPHVSSVSLEAVLSPTSPGPGAASIQYPDATPLPIVAAATLIKPVFKAPVAQVSKPKVDIYAIAEGSICESCQ